MQGMGWGRIVMAWLFHQSLVAPEVLVLGWLGCVLCAPFAYFFTRRSRRALRVLGYVMMSLSVATAIASIAVGSDALEFFSIYDGFLLLLFCGPLVLFGVVTVWVSHAPPEVVQGIERCNRCGYLLTGLRDQRCPECGERFGSEGL